MPSPAQPAQVRQLADRRRRGSLQPLQRTEPGLASGQADILESAALEGGDPGFDEFAAELLGLELAMPEPGGRLAENGRFFYTTAEQAGQTELLAGADRAGDHGRPRPPRQGII